jgi:cobalt-precorrin-5B (C1)-methyltransferase
MHKLREGFTTGSASTAAIIAALRALYLRESPSFVRIKAPAGVLKIPVKYVLFSDDTVTACVVKDGGDDPDCTHRVEIVAEVRNYEGRGETEKALNLSGKFAFIIGTGIGIVTMKGLGINVGESAINPVPRKMIKENVEAFLAENNIREKPCILLSVPNGAEVAKHTLNERLGIIGGISILGTTGIVKPVSLEAFTATIDVSLNIAKTKKLKTVILCFGRTSEDGAKKYLDHPAEAYVMMGDFFRYALDKARKKGFKVIVSGQPGKILKACLDSENTNVKYGIFSPVQTAELLMKLGIKKSDVKKLSAAKTARHMCEITGREKMGYVWESVVKFLAKKFGIKVMLFSYEGELIAKE